MSVYDYDVPILVRHTNDESDELLPTKKKVVDFVIGELPNATWRDYFPEQVRGVDIEALKDRLIVRVHTDSTLPSKEESEQVLHWLDGWMRYGYFADGLTLYGPYYGYNTYDDITVYTWDDKLKITSRDRLVETFTHKGESC